MKIKLTRKKLIPITSVLALLFALLIGSFAILINGDNPVVAYKELFKGSFITLQNLANTLSSATVLIFTGLGVTVSFKVGMANIGAEGQLYMGAISATIIGLFLPFPSYLLIPTALSVAFLFGGLYGMIPAFLKAKTGTNEVVTTLMLNYVAVNLTSYLVNYPLKAEGAPLGMTETVQKAAKLPIIIPGTRLNVGFLMAIVIAVIVALFFKFTRTGFEMRIQGENRLYGRYIGINTERRLIQGMFLGGGLSGLGGAILALGIQYKFVQNISPGYGFDGLTIALMASFNEYVVIPISILFGALRSGSINMELHTSVPSELSEVVQAIVILFMAAQSSFATNLFNWFSSNDSRRRSTSRKSGGTLG